MQNIIITGTDTEIGKTYTTCLILKALNAKGIPAVGYKPMACGDRGDARSMLKVCAPGPTLDEVNPIYLKAATCPLVAARLEHTTVSIADVVAGYAHMVEKYKDVVVEGVGGWEVPVAEGKMFSDVAQALSLPIVLVVGNKLGSLNHAFLTLEAIKARGLKCVGIIMNHLSEAWDTACVTNRTMLEDMCDTPILGEIIHGQDELDIDPLLAALETAK